MKKIVLRLAILVVVVLAILFFARNLIARRSVEIGVEKVTGFPLDIASVHIAPSFGRLEVRDLHLMNPPEFAEETFVLMPELTVDYQVGSMIKGAPHINEMVIDIAEVAIVKNADGTSNLEKLKGVADGDKEDEPETEEPDEAGPQYQVDHLRIHIGNVTIKDYSRGGEPSVRKIVLNIDADYENINDSTDITRLVLITMMSRVRLPDFGIDTAGLTQGLGDVAGAAGEAVKDTAEAVGEATKGLFDSIKKAVPGNEK